MRLLDFQFANKSSYLNFLYQPARSSQAADFLTTPDAFKQFSANFRYRQDMLNGDHNDLTKLLDSSYLELLDQNGGWALLVT